MSDLSGHTHPPGSAANPGKRARSVLVISLGGIADFVSTLGVAAAIRSHHPTARLTLLAQPAIAKLVEKCPYFDAVELDGRVQEPRKVLDLVRRLRAANHDIVYDLHGSNRTERYFVALQPKPPLWSGPAVGATFPAPDRRKSELHVLDRLTTQVVAAGVPAPVKAPFTPTLSWIRKTLRDPPRLQPAYFSLAGAFMLLTLDGTPGLAWSADSYARLARFIADGGVTPVLVGGADEAALAMETIKLAGVKQNRVLNLVGRADPYQVACLAEHALCAMGPETGFMHLAVVAGAPAVVMMPTFDANPWLRYPRGPKGVVMLTAPQVAQLTAGDAIQALKALPEWQAQTRYSAP